MPSENIKIATWNLCLGLLHKKNIVKNYILENRIDICNMQEVDIVNDCPKNLMSFPGYKIEIETNESKSRVATYIKDNIKYVRRIDLEGKNNHLVIIDIEQNPKMRIINIYRSFNPQREKFKYQLQLTRNALNESTIDCAR